MWLLLISATKDKKKKKLFFNFLLLKSQQFLAIILTEKPLWFDVKKKRFGEKGQNKTHIKIKDGFRGWNKKKAATEKTDKGLIGSPK